MMHKDTCNVHVFAEFPDRNFSQFVTAFSKALDKFVSCDDLERTSLFQYTAGIVTMG